MADFGGIAGFVDPGESILLVAAKPLEETARVGEGLRSFLKLEGIPQLLEKEALFVLLLPPMAK